MLDYVKKQLEAGHDMVSFLALGGNTQLVLKAKVELADEIGMVLRVKGMLGGIGEPKVYPWSAIGWLSWE